MRAIMACVAVVMASLLLHAAAAAERSAMHVSGAIDQSTVATSHVASAYLTLANDAAADDRLLSVSCRWCGAVEIHALQTVRGKSEMRLMAYGVRVPAHRTVSLSPTTAHVMLIGPRVALPVGRQVTITLNFHRAGPVRISLPVTNMCRPASDAGRPGSQRH